MQDNNKKFTWEGLEKLNVNELKGLTQVNFDPASLIGNEDEEDKMYMQEYMKINNSSKNPTKQIKERKNLEQYGEIRSSSAYLREGGRVEANPTITPSSPSKKGSPLKQHNSGAYLR